ncbi:hypothetical protein D918_09674 [Trichuris suis]|nr:hypothetical protein D918_09674 [Trichuris suis]
MMAVSLLYAVLFSVSKFHAEGGSIVVNTTSGWYKGKVIDMGNQRVYAFLNVTYGRPPVGANRFRPPQPAPYSNGIIQADRLAQACYQLMDKTYPGESLFAFKRLLLRIDLTCCNNASA